MPCLPHPPYLPPPVVCVCEWWIALHEELSSNEEAERVLYVFIAKLPNQV